MNRRILNITLLLFSTAHLLYSQSITNVEARAEANTVVVSYQLQSPNPVEISLHVSEDGGLTFAGPLRNVRGDVGRGIQQGSRRIVWEVLKEKEFLHNSNMVFRVKEVSPFGIFRDPRDGQTYKTVIIGKQVWMADNLAYKPSSGNYWAYGNKSSNLAKYGYLYDWQIARNVCPMGWHLPTDAEWAQLSDFVGTNAGLKLKAKSGWSSNGNGTDDYGFSALPGGDRHSNGSFSDMGRNCSWWSSTENDATSAWSISVYFGSGPLSRSYYNKRSGYSVRCLRDN